MPNDSWPKERRADAADEADDGSPFTGPVVARNLEGTGRFVIVCDHASNRFPAEFGALGLRPEQREAHIAWDPGALGVSERLSQALDGPLVHPTVSRLLIDCNRSLDAADLIPARSESHDIPGNTALSPAARQLRIASIHEPYHRAIEALIERRLEGGRATSLIAAHSFTPVYRGALRPWEIGVLFEREASLPKRLIDRLRSEGFNVGVNEPYSPADGVYYTLSRHGDARGLATVMIEIRNDLIRTEESQQEWAERIAAIVAQEPEDNEAALDAPPIQEGWKATSHD